MIGHYRYSRLKNYSFPLWAAIIIALAPHSPVNRTPKFDRYGRHWQCLWECPKTSPTSSSHSNPSWGIEVHTVCLGYQEAPIGESQPPTSPKGRGTLTHNFQTVSNNSQDSRSVRWELFVGALMGTFSFSAWTASLGARTCVFFCVCSMYKRHTHLPPYRGKHLRSSFYTKKCRCILSSLYKPYLGPDFVYKGLP